MKKGWRIIITIVLVAILLGAVSVGVGLMTGGDLPRIYAALDERYHPALYYDYVLQVIDVLWGAVRSAVA